MNINEIRELAQIFTEHGLTVLDVGEGENHVRLEKTAAPVAATPVAAAPALEPIPAPDFQAETAQEIDPGINFADVTEVKSPMVGVFYSAPTPDAEPFVKVGSRVKKGDVLCIIEAMKLMNEIVAEQDGEVVDRCVENGDVVEYGQTLFKIY